MRFPLFTKTESDSINQKDISRRADHWFTGGFPGALTRVGAIVKELAVAPLCLLLSPVD